MAHPLSVKRAAATAVPPVASSKTDLRVAFLGTYPPRRCGIATFTRDLADAVRSASDHVLPMALAVTDPGGQYEYGDGVSYEIRQGVKGDYARAAEFVNFSDVRLVGVQHEYGIFGGDDGAYVLDFLSALRVPALVTLHTVLKAPSASQREIVVAMAQQCAGVVVMSQIAARLLAESYGVDGSSVHVIPHGIPNMDARDQQPLKATFGLAAQRMLLTFGLLGPNKGVETVLGALPALVSEFPDLVYFVVGATHPMVVRRHGEAYRTKLERQAEELDVRDHVVFRDQFVTIEELCRYLQAADIFVSPYLNEAQVTSGALSYAMGAGAAAVSTPYWHAQELLAEGRGRLFPFGDSDALAGVLGSLLRSPSELAEVRQSAYQFTRSMIWPRVGRAYLELGQTVMETPLKSLPHRRASGLPELRLDHLRRLTDDTGIIQHATFSVPARRTGYCVDDNARALIVALQADRLESSPETTRLVTTYLGFLHHAQTDDGRFANFLRYDRTFEAGAISDDCIGRAVWALGTTVQLVGQEGHRCLARAMIRRASSAITDLNLRGTASAMLGLVAVVQAGGDAQNERELLGRLAGKVVERYQQEQKPDWHWFEPTVTYDNALIPLALFKTYGTTGDRATLRAAREALEFLEEMSFENGHMVLVGNAGWHARGGIRAHADEQALDAAAFVLAFRGAYLATRDHHYLCRMREAFAWFLGTNRLGMALYDFDTGGCRDGLGVAEINQNQGAESTLAFLLSLLEMLELAGEGLEYTDRVVTGAH